ncbi:MAG TPA: ABC transporter substrate-binding protein [Solirubrobacteraceae bacterium]|jgi:taurine transport system substrate-binding protein|nr:ABC transporter substrate-binding protein [Solirubrobacteraceae bacterium]
MKTPLRPARAALGATLVLAALAATTTPSLAAPAPAKITIAYQAIPNGDLVVKHERWLEKALPNTKISWKLFDSGGDVNTAVAAHAVDFGLAGSSPVARGLSTKIDYEVPWIHDVIGTAEALAVKKGINSVKDLKGKTIATPLASTSHYSLLAALKEAGLSQSDVKIIDAEPDAIVAAWQRGDIDGAYTWNPSLAKLLAAGAHTIVDSAQLSKKGYATYDLGTVSTSFAKKHPDVVATWVAQEDRAVKLYRSDRARWAKDVGAELSLSTKDVLSQAAGLQFLTAKQQLGKAYLGGGLLTNLYATGAFNKDLGQIPSVAPRSAYAKAIYAAAAKKVAAG